LPKVPCIYTRVPFDLLCAWRTSSDVCAMRP